MTQQREKSITSQLFALFLIAAVLIGTGTLALRAAEETPQDTWVDWVKETAIQFKTLDWRGVNLQDLQSLDSELEGKRVVFLGEPDHYVHEKYHFRLILIRYLFRKGWRYIGMEMGRSDGIRADKFLETGEQNWLRQMAVYGYRDDGCKKRENKSGKGRAPEKQGFVNSIVRDEKWFFRQLRSINENLAPGQSRIRWFGYDLDMYPGGGYRDAEEILHKHSRNSLLQDIIDSLACVEKETLEQEVERLKSALEIIVKNKDYLQQVLGKDRTVWSRFMFFSPF